MATLILENLPDELIEKIQQLAQQHNQSVNEQVIFILEQAVKKPQTPLEFLISPETDPTWEERRKATPKILAEIRSRPRVNPTNFGLPDSTELIREDRDR
jgi:plasmid stability protein